MSQPRVQLNPAAQQAMHFSGDEFSARVTRARIAMSAMKLDAIVLTSEANLEYLSGFETQFAWVTPSRPWYFVVPRDREAFAVIPEIGITNWKTTSWCEDIDAWPSPRPEDEGIDILVQRISNLPRTFGRVGFEIGPESRIGMPVADLLRLRDLIQLEIADCSVLMAELRLIKSAAEVARIRHICSIAGKSFEEVLSSTSHGETEGEIYRRFCASLLLNGADRVPYVSIASAPGGYESIIRGPIDRRVGRGDVMILDTGSKFGGYFCDYDRNFSFGRASETVTRVYDALWLATEAGMKAALPGRTAADVFKAQADVLIAHGFEVGNVGRFGHGLGKIVTEYPSNAPGDHTILKPGMVLTIEPSAMFANGIMAHEEDIVITEGSAEILSPRASRDIPVIEC